jgi:hypothetical protein
LIHNEKVKLTAACLNTIAAATIVTGVVAPLVAVVFGFPTAGAMSAHGFALASVAWLSFGVALHFLARGMLGRLRA